MHRTSAMKVHRPGLPSNRGRPFRQYTRVCPAMKNRVPRARAHYARTRYTRAPTSTRCTDGGYTSADATGLSGLLRSWSLTQHRGWGRACTVSEVDRRSPRDGRSIWRLPRLWWRCPRALRQTRHPWRNAVWPPSSSPRTGRNQPHPEARTT